MQVVINGFGRIGRTVLHAWALGKRWPGVEIVGINDIAEPGMLAYLFEYDSTFGPYPGSVDLRGSVLHVDRHAIPLTRVSDPAQLAAQGASLVMDCTGRSQDRAAAVRALDSGAARVLVSGPCAGADLTLVIGANDHLLADQPVVSNASCTTNALAPLVRLLDDRFGVQTGWMTTIHCYTGSQPTVDAPRESAVRSRAAALSMVPTTTSAQKLLDVVLPHLAGRVQGAAVRVPVASVSAVDLTLMTDARPDADTIRAALRDPGARAAGIIGCTDRPLVSSDLRARPESIVMALPETQVTPGGLLRVFGWYDNEWGFSCRMLDAAARMAQG